MLAIFHSDNPETRRIFQHHQHQHQQSLFKQEEFLLTKIHTTEILLGTKYI